MSYETMFPNRGDLGFEPPLGFEDESYENELIPHFIDSRNMLSLWVNWPGESPRFRLHVLAADGSDGKALIKSNNWMEVLQVYRKNIGLEDFDFEGEIHNALSEVFDDAVKHYDLIPKASLPWNDFISVVSNLMKKLLSN